MILAPFPSTPPARGARRIAALLCLSLALTAGGAPAARAQSPNALPSLGDSASDDLSVGAERAIGDQIMREIRRDPDYLDDPVLLEYLQTIWQRLLVAAQARGNIPIELETRYPFEPFLVRERSINAFALPGGYIGVHLGLIAMTGSPDELASVLAHELSHITQRHIARSIAPSRQASILSIATTILGVIAMGRARSADTGNAANAVIAGGQAAAIQSQLNFSRDMEREADRVGYGVLVQAGYSPTAMAEMFEKLDKESHDAGNYPYLRTHPLTVERIGEARSRAGVNTLPLPPPNPLEHTVARARARVLMETRNEGLRRLEGLDASIAPPPASPDAAFRDSRGERLPDVLVEAVGGSIADRLGTAYASALAATLLRDWARADVALAQAFTLARGSPRREDRALRAVQMLAAQSMLDRGDPARAAAALAPLRSDASRPVLLLQAQTALAAAAQASVAGTGPTAALLALPELQRSADALQTWVATHPQDADAWKALSQIWARLAQPLRSLRADAEAQLAIGDFSGAIDRLRAAQRMARSGGQVDFIEASVVDARLRAIDAQRRALLADDKKNGRGGEPQ